MTEYNPTFAYQGYIRCVMCCTMMLIHVKAKLLRVVFNFVLTRVCEEELMGEKLTASVQEVHLDNFLNSILGISVKIAFKKMFGLENGNLILFEADKTFARSLNQFRE